MKSKTFKFSVINLVLIFSLIFNLSCKKEQQEDEPQTTQSIQFDNSQTTRATFLGQIVDENDAPLENVSVQTGNHTVHTDEDGFFYFSNISTPSEATLLKVTQPGYFDGYRAISVLPNTDNQVKIMLLKLTAPTFFNVKTGGTIQVPNGGSIEFPENALVVESTNTPYTGTASVYARWINPDDEHLLDFVPGALRGASSTGSEKSLITYGMQAVDLYGSGGEKLQLAKGKLAKVHFPIPSRIISEAPSTIPLWSLNENVGLWQEEGSATKVGTEYIGSVSHFSYWNCDYPGALVDYKATFTYDNKPLANKAIELVLKINIPRKQGRGYTNSNGKTFGKVPASQAFDLYVRDNSTGKYVFIKSFNTTSSNIDLGTIDLKGKITGPPKPTLITGTLVDCKNKVIPNGIVKVKTPGLRLIRCNSSGVFSYTSLFSGSRLLKLKAYNPITKEMGLHSTTINGGQTNNLGNVVACGQISQFITWKSTYNGTTTSHSIVESQNSSFNLNYRTNNTYVSGWSNSKNAQFYFGGLDNSTSAHTLTYWSDSQDSSSVIPNPINVSITKYGAKGSFVEGSFKGIIKTSSVPSKTIDCTFRVTRNN